MKYTLLFLMISTFALAQNPEVSSGKAFKFAPQSRVFIITSANFGDNQLADAYGSNIGIGTSLSFFSVLGIRPALHYELSHYKLEKPEVVGNVNATASYWSLFGTLAYELPLTDRVGLAPDLGVGYAQLRLSPGNEKYGKQDGVQYRAGFTTDYKIGKSTTVFAAVHYIYSSFDVKTHPDFKSYFDQAQQVQLTLGLQFGKR